MITIKSNSHFFLTKLHLLLEQKNFAFISKKNEKYFSELNIIYNKNSTYLKFEGKSSNLNFPLRFDYLMNEIFKILSSYKINFGSLIYWPINETLSDGNKEIKLRNTHSIILSKIVLHNLCISKDLLYKSIWPKEKSIQINKLDTHLTNFKNFLFDEFKYKLNFKSSAGLLTFQAD